jgi:hypothetical protein
MIDFPNSPTIGQIFSYGVLSWKWDGAKWVAASASSNPRYIVGCFSPGVLVDNQMLLSYPLTKGVTFPGNFGTYLGHTSFARGTAVTTSSITINARKATAAAPTAFTTIGTITFAAGALLGVLATTGGAAVSFNQGDTLALVAPATHDTTFAGFSATLVGYES